MIQAHPNAPHRGCPRTGTRLPSDVEPNDPGRVEPNAEPNEELNRKLNEEPNEEPEFQLPLSVQPQQHAKLVAQK